jgi:undecaprenyl-diphosphatase
MSDFFYSIDLSILYFFNHTLSAGFPNRFFSTITNVNNWYIAYAILIGICFFKGGTKGKLAVAGIILLILAADQFSHNILKELFQRTRPCNALSDILTPTGCLGSYSLPSNHAVNNFAAATFFFLLYRNLKWILFITAFLVSISRIYLGLHYPSDVLAGAIIGILFGYIFALGVLKLTETISIKKMKVDS